MQLDGFKELLSRAQSGDVAAMERLLAEIRPHLERVALQHADPDRTAESASDLVQEAELRAWRKIGQFSLGPDDRETLAKFCGWMGQIVRRLGLDSRRNRSAQRRSPDRPVVHLDRPVEPGSSAGCGLQPAGDEPTPSARLRSVETAQQVRAAIEELVDPIDREIIRRYFFEQRTLAEIAAAIEIGYDAAKYRYRTAMAVLERKLGSLL